MNQDFARQPYWWDATPPWSPPANALPARGDVVVVGGGYSGLCAALELARNGTSVTVLEADQFGFNASGRNSGGVSFGLDATKAARWHKWTGLGAAPSAADLLRGAADSFAHVEQFIAREGIVCDFQKNGRLACAPTPGWYDILSKRAERLNKLQDAGAYMVPRAEQLSEIGSDSFFGVMVVARSAQLDPALYVRSLAERCVAAGASLHAGTTVRGIARHAGGYAIETSAGRVEAKNVVLAANAMMRGLSESLGSRIVPVASHIIVTEPLPDALADSLLPKRRSGADNKRLLAYFRRTPDGKRFLYGGRASPVELSETETAATLYRQMVDRFPQLKDVRIGHAWGCKVAFTFDALPHMGTHDGLHYLVGCNGNGVAMMSYLGHQVARKLLTGEKSVCVFDQPGFPKPPLYNGKPWFLPMVATTYRTLDRFDAVRTA